MCLAHYCPASSEQSIFLTKSTPIGNVKPNFPPPQSYAAPTPYAPVLALCTVHTVVPSIVAWGDKNLHTYLKPRNKHHRLEGLLRFKKPNKSRKLYSFRVGFYQVLWNYANLCTFQTVLLPALKYAVMLGEKRCLYISGRKKAQITEPRNTTKTTVKDLQHRATSELKIGCSIKECVTKRLWHILPVFFCPQLNNIHYFLTSVTLLLSLSRGKGTKNTCKIDAAVTFFSAVADNITVKTKRK